MKWMYYYLSLTFIGFLLIVIAIAPSAEELRTQTLEPRNALKFTDVYVHHGDFKRDVAFHSGDVMFAHYLIDRRRTCAVSTQFRLIMLREQERFGGIFSYGYPLIHYYGPPAKYEINEYLRIPIDMPAGHYELRQLNFIECGNNANWTEFAPAAPLTIEPS